LHSRTLMAPMASQRRAVNVERHDRTALWRVHASASPD